MAKLDLTSCITTKSVSNTRFKVKKIKQCTNYKPSMTLCRNLRKQPNQTVPKQTVKHTRFLLPSSKTCITPNTRKTVQADDLIVTHTHTHTHTHRAWNNDIYTDPTFTLTSSVFNVFRILGR